MLNRLRFWWRNRGEERMRKSRLKWLKSLKIPTHLEKATCDMFIYACGLVDGTILYFTEASEDAAGWITLTLHDGDMMIENGKRSNNARIPPCPRGIQVQISAIVWVADAPEGS
jgi:hypothetical protein